MKALGLNEIREAYLKFFESKEHLRLNSFSLVPHNDKSLLLINSGMAPMKAFFTGQEIPPSKRVTTCQKCIRTGDIENVGITARHGTFFEMLGNFSFGDYFKEEIIPWSWEFLTEVMEIPEDRLYVSVYQDDEEALKIWNEKVGLDKSKIFKMGKADNFWEHGLGPCGPCSEIYYDKGEAYGCSSPDCTVGCECDRYMEVWNLVFTQFEKLNEDTYEDLEFPNIDTGMGLERIATVMQDVNSIFDIDTIKELRDEVCKILNVKYGAHEKTDISVRVITDHIRSVTFMTSDGVLPSNEGRGYVLRRLIRRAIMHGKLLGVDVPMTAQLSKIVIKTSKGAYPELEEKQEYILKVLTVEEKRFYDTLDQGMELVQKHIKTLKESGNTINNKLLGSEAFRLYDTFGFPLELLKEILMEKGIEVDEEAFYAEMDEQKNRARSAREESTYMGADATIFDELDPTISTEFFGYNNEEVKDSKVLFIIKDNESVKEASKDDEVVIILDKTVMYAESGGQKGDIGTIKSNNAVVKISDCIKVGGNKFGHIGKVVEDNISVGDTVSVKYDKKNRLSVGRNHTAAHLLQKALKDVLGNHIEQAGSNVNSERMRFDFTHFSSLTSGEISHIEKLVNEKILECLPVVVSEKSINEAREMGALALFGEKYGDKVRVVDVSNYSVELCGGTHIDNTAILGGFKIISETGVSAGVRRIEALTGEGLHHYYRKLDENLKIIQQIAKATPDNIVNKVKSYIEQTKELNKELEKVKQNANGNIIDDLIGQIDTVEGVAYIGAKIDNIDGNGLKSIGDKIKEKQSSVVILLATEKEDKVTLVSMVSDDLVKQGVHAGNIIKETSQVVGGKGGGRPNMAQGGGVDGSKISDAIIKGKELVQEQLKK